MRTIKVSNKSTPWLTTEFKNLPGQEISLRMQLLKNSAIIMESYEQIRNKVNNLNKKLKREYFSKKVACNNGNLKGTWKAINLLLNKRSKTTKYCQPRSRWSGCSG